MRVYVSNDSLTHVVVFKVSLCVSMNLLVYLLDAGLFSDGVDLHSSPTCGTTAGNWPARRGHVGYS